MSNIPSLLPLDRTPVEVELEQVSAKRWQDLDVDIIRRSQDPWRVPAHLLNYLAFDWSVDIWNTDWPELKKRSVLANAARDHSLKGTLEGTRRYLEIADAKIVQVVRRPQGFAVSRNLTKAEQEEWIEKHPRVRLSLFRGNGHRASRSGFFVGSGALGHDGMRIDLGPSLYGRKAYLKQGDTEIPLDTYNVATRDQRRNGVRIDRFVIPGVTNKGSVIGRMAVGRHFVGTAGKNPQVYTFQIDEGYFHRESKLSIDSLAPGYQPRDIKRYRVSEQGFAGSRLFVGRSPIARTAIGRDQGDYLLADVLYLVDPSIDVPRVQARSFVGYTRISMQPHQADILVDWQKKVNPRRHFIINLAAVGRMAVRRNDTSRRDFLLETIRSSKRLSDKIRVSFQLTRDRTLAIGAPLDGSVRLGDRVPNRL